MAKWWQDALGLLKRKGPLKNDEIRAGLSNSALLDLATRSPDMQQVMNRLDVALRKIDNADPAAAAHRRQLLDSPRLADRVEGMRLVQKHFEDALRVGGARSYGELIARCLDEMGPEALRAVPAIEFAYRRHLGWLRRRGRGGAPSFEDWLRASRSDRLDSMLRLLLTAARARGLRGATHVYSPARAGLTIEHRTARALVAELGAIADKVPDGLFDNLMMRKLEIIAGGNRARRGLAAILRDRRISIRIASSELKKLFLLTDRTALQGNVGETLAKARQIERIADLEKARPDAPIFLFSDVRVTGDRTLVEKAAARQAGPGGSSVLPGDIPDAELRRLEGESLPAGDVRKQSLEYSDDIAVDMAEPGRPRFLEHYETKVTKDSVGDGVGQIRRNREVMSVTEEISVGKVYRRDGDRLVEVPLDQVPGASVVRDAKGNARLVFRENERWLKRSDELMEQFTDDIAELRRTMPEGPRLDAAVDARIARLEAEMPARNLQNVQGSRRVLFTPRDKTGHMPHDVDHESLAFGYKDIVDLCNLLLLRAGFERAG